MGFYRKKPVTIEAVQFDGTPGGAVSVFGVFDIPGAKFVPSCDLERGEISIPTLEGVMRAGAGDYIIKGVQGEFYPCKPDIFAATYDESPPVFDAEMKEGPWAERNPLTTVCDARPFFGR